MCSLNACRHFPSSRHGHRPSKTVMSLCLVALVGMVAGCVTQMRGVSGRPVVVQPLDIILQTDATNFGLAKVGILPFTSPHYAPGIGKGVTETYWQELMQGGVFRSFVRLPQVVKNEQDALWWGRHDNCDLVIWPTVTYLLDGTGGLPTHLHTAIQILDVRSGTPLWIINQKAYSEPGPDIDLVWHSLPGSPAQRHSALTKALAEQFSGYFTDSVVKQSKNKGK